MERFSFAGVVGLLSVCASIAVSGGYFEKKEILGVGDCFRPDPFWGMQVKSQSCITGPYAVLPTTSCATVWTFDKVYALNTGLFYNMIEANENCSGGAVFCCMTVIQDQIPCPGQPAIDLGAGPLRYRVSQVYCKVN